MAHLMHCWDGLCVAQVTCKLAFNWYLVTLNDLKWQAAKVCYTVVARLHVFTGISLYDCPQRLYILRKCWENSSRNVDAKHKLNILVMKCIAYQHF